MNKALLTSMPVLVQDYLNYLISTKGKSDLTVQGYALDIQIFFRFMMIRRGIVPEDTPFNEIDIHTLDLDFMQSIRLEDAYAFLAYCQRERKNSAAARARKAVSIKRFFRYLSLDQRYMERNPLQDLESPKLKKSQPKYLTLDQSLDLLQCIDGNFRERDYCMITLFLNCGLRLSELVGLNLSDIRSDNTMRIVGKGNKERTVYLNSACQSALRRYLQVRPADGLQDRNALFISRNHRRISVRAVQEIVEKFLKKAGLSDQGFSVHKLRHTAATLMYQHGHVDVLLLKEILGHENLSTTEIYTHVADSQLRSAVEANPLNSLSPSPSDTQEN